MLPWQVLGGPLQPSSQCTADAQGMLLQQILSIQVGTGRAPAVPREQRWPNSCKKHFGHLDAFCLLPLPSLSLPCEPHHRERPVLSSSTRNFPLDVTVLSVSSSPSCEIFLIVTGHEKHTFFPQNC